MAKFKGVSVNPELPIVLIIAFFLVLFGLGILILGGNSNFNFYSSKIVVDGQNIKEELHFKPDKDYHTLYRSFTSEIYSFDNSDIISKNYILIKEIECSNGNYYFKEYHGKAYPENYAYTENNEYGCTFGSALGFFKGEDYIINSEYEVHAENLFLVDGEYYIKFVAYSPGNHVNLNKGNFIVQGDVVKKNRYYSNENVILYIPYNGDIKWFNIIELDDFEFDSGLMFWKILFSILPGLLVFGLWFFTGKERVYGSIPKEVSEFPSKRNAWEVAAYFNPPLSRLDKNLFSSVLLKFYNNKIIEIKEKGKDIFIKLNKFKGDEVEKKIYDILEFIYLNIRRDKDKKYLDGEYFNLKGFTNSIYYQYSISKLLFVHYKDLKEDIKNKGKKYIDDSSEKFIYPFFIVAIFLILFLLMKFNIFSGIMLISYFFMLIFVIILSVNNILFLRFNGEYYIEYQKWRAFKKYLKNSFSIKTATHKTVVIWNEYLIYATALGVPDKVIKELKVNHLINEQQTEIYNGITSGSFFGFAFSSSAGAGGVGGSGGFGGAGGGGVGGGGGGGR